MLTRTKTIKYAWLSHDWVILHCQHRLHSYWTHRMSKKDLNGAPLLERATLDGALKESPVVHNLQGNRTHLSLIFSLFRKWYVFTCVLDAHVRKHETEFGTDIVGQSVKSVFSSYLNFCNSLLVNDDVRGQSSGQRWMTHPRLRVISHVIKFCAALRVWREIKRHFAHNEADYSHRLCRDTGRGRGTGLLPLRLRLHQQHHGVRQAQPARHPGGLPALMPGNHRLHSLDLVSHQCVMKDCQLFLNSFTLQRLPDNMYCELKDQTFALPYPGAVSGPRSC